MNEGDADDPDHQKTEANHDKPRRILVVEDMLLQALALAQMLEDAGYTIIGPFSEARSAREAALTQAPDLAVLDVNLGADDPAGGESIAETLLRMDVPFIFLSANDRSTLAAQLRAFPHVRKPFEKDALLRVVAANLAPASNGVTGER